MKKEFDPQWDGDFHRDDSGAEKKAGKEYREESSFFVRDKRPRIRRVTETLNERKPREGAESEEQKPDVRRSYTRNFDDPRSSEPVSEDRRRPFRTEDDRRPFPREDNDRRTPYRNDRPYDRDETPRRHSFNPNFDENNRRVPGRNDRYERNPEEDNRFNSYRYDREGDSRPPQRSQHPYHRDDRRTDRYGSQNRPYPNRYGDNRDDRAYSPRTDRPGGYDRNTRPDNRNRPPRPGQYNNRNDNRGNNRKPSDPFRTPKGGYDSTFKPKVYPAYAAARIEEPIRLNKYISMSGLCSRREADEYIQAGDITVNGQKVTELGVKINPSDEIRYKGDVLQGEKRIYILMNKPKGFVTTLEDPNAEKTVMDIVKNACQERVYPVGRLDKNSLGVLLITNDGELTKKLTHPGNEKKKIYQVALDRSATIQDLEKLYEGIELEDGLAKVDEVEFLDDKRREIGLSIHSGRNRIVRRMFEELGYHVQKLDRVYFAGLTKKGLRRGAWRYLTPKEVAMLKTGSYA